MEIIIGLVVVVALGLLWHTNRKKAEAIVEDAPYKVETPVTAVDIAPQPEPATTPIPLVVEGAGVVEVPAAKKAPAKKPAAPKAKAPAKKPVAKKVPAKKPAAPKKAK